jgi:hypothetical protein
MNQRINLNRAQILRLLDGFAVQLPTEVGMLEFEAVPEEPWVPMQSVDMSAVLPAYERVGVPAPDAIWASPQYEAHVKEHPESGVTHLSIKRMDRQPIRNWRHFQQIKNEVCGEFREGVELYPGEHRIADNANQYHLFVLPEGMEMPLGFESGMVMIDPDEVSIFNTNGDKGRQEPLQPGLTIGEKMAAAALSEDDERVRRQILRGDLSEGG